MEITFNTPALLFPAISLLLLAYTNRYLALANLIRKLHDEYMRGEKITCCSSRSRYCVPASTWYGRCRRSAYSVLYAVW